MRAFFIYFWTGSTLPGETRCNTTRWNTIANKWRNSDEGSTVLYVGADSSATNKHWSYELAIYRNWITLSLYLYFLNFAMIDVWFEICSRTLSSESLLQSSTRRIYLSFSTASHYTARPFVSWPPEKGRKTRLMVHISCERDYMETHG